MQLLQSSLKVFLLIGMAFWLAGCLPVEEEEEVSVSAPATSWYKDADGDTYGDPGTEIVGDQPDLSWVEDNTDCDDTNANANPSELETADRVDNDCDGEVDNGFKYAFVTSSAPTGNLGGLAGADTICQNLADAAVPALPAGTYTAWLSSSLEDARDRVTDDQSNTFTYVNTGGVGIAAGFVSLVDGGLDSSIRFDESSTLVAGVTEVWTDTGVDGTSFSGGAVSCKDWTYQDEHDFGYYGSSQSVGSQWTLVNGQDCEQFKRLYCIQK